MTGRIILHKRAYEIESSVEDGSHFRLTGHLRDVKPDGLWGIPDDQPMTIHHMQLDLVVDATTLVITSVQAQMHVHPQDQCPVILAAYQQLVGISIARGFTHKVREMFGGPRACTHIGALVIAMAPVAIQSLWGFLRAVAPEGGGSPAAGSGDVAAELRRDFERNRDTCHVWASEGPMFALLESGADVPPPMWAQHRLEELGIDAGAWRAGGN